MMCFNFDGRRLHCILSCDYCLSNGMNHHFFFLLSLFTVDFSKVNLLKHLHIFCHIPKWNIQFSSPIYSMNKICNLRKFEHLIYFIACYIHTLESNVKIVYFAPDTFFSLSFNINLSIFIVPNLQINSQHCLRSKLKN